jgi:hypothetical protein
MEDQLVQLLANTQQQGQAPRQQAEIELKRARTNPAYPTSLVNVASHTSIDLAVRQAALSTLRLFIESEWSPEDLGSEPQIPISDEARAQIKQSLLDLALSQEDDRKIKTAAR